MDKMGWFFIFTYIFFLIVSISSIYILYKKPGDLAVKLFFICIQLCMILTNTRFMFYQDVLANIANSFFVMAACINGPIMIHFHLIFPEKSSLIIRFSKIHYVFYTLSFIGIIYIFAYYYFLYSPASKAWDYFNIIDKLCVMWLSLATFVAMLIALNQYSTIKNTLAKNQLKIIVLGASTTLILPVVYGFFPRCIGQII